MLVIELVVVPLLVFGIVTDQVVALRPAELNILVILVTLEVLKMDKSRLVKLLQPLNIYRM